MLKLRNQRRPMYARNDTNLVVRKIIGHDTLGTRSRGLSHARVTDLLEQENTVTEHRSDTLLARERCKSVNVEDWLCQADRWLTLGVGNGRTVPSITRTRFLSRAGGCEGGRSVVQTGHLYDMQLSLSSEHIPKEQVLLCTAKRPDSFDLVRGASAKRTETSKWIIIRRGGPSNVAHGSFKRVLDGCTVITEVVPPRDGRRNTSRVLVQAVRLRSGNSRR